MRTKALAFISPIILLCAGVSHAACSGGMYNAVQQVGASGGSTPVEGYWCLNETGTITSATINDYGNGSADNGTYAAASVATTTGLVADGSSNTAVSFTGAVNSTATLGSIPNASKWASLSAFTVTLWYKTASLTGATNNPRLVATGAAANSNAGWNLALNPATGPGGIVQTSNGTSGTNACIGWANIADGSTHFVAFGVTGTTVFCSEDAATYTTTTGVNYAAPSLAMIIGNSPDPTDNSNAAPGTYQHIAIFSGQLTQANLTTLYNCGNSGTCPVVGAQGGIIIGQ